MLEACGGCPTQPLGRPEREGHGRAAAVHFSQGGGSPRGSTGAALAHRNAQSTVHLQELVPLRKRSKSAAAPRAAEEVAAARRHGGAEAAAEGGSSVGHAST